MKKKIFKGHLGEGMIPSIVVQKADEEEDREPDERTQALLKAFSRKKK